MIDHVYKQQMDRLWNQVAKGFVRAGITPNAVTWTSLFAVLIASSAFVVHRSFFWLALTVGLAELLDNIDGAIARVGNSASKAGSFLDSTTDRIKEIAMFTVVGEVSGAYLPAMLALSGGMAASYNLAKGQAEGATLTMRFPPLVERLERITLLCVGAALTSYLPLFAGRSAIEWTLWLLVVGNHFTALQRLHAGFTELRRR